MQTYEQFINEKGAEVSELAKQQQLKDIVNIVENSNGNPTDRDNREIAKIQNRQLLPGKKWFLQHKPGKN